MRSREALFRDRIMVAKHSTAMREHEPAIYFFINREL